MSWHLYSPPHAIRSCWGTLFCAWLPCRRDDLRTRIPCNWNKWNHPDVLAFCGCMWRSSANIPHQIRTWSTRFDWQTFWQCWNILGIVAGEVDGSPWGCTGSCWHMGRGEALGLRNLHHRVCNEHVRRDYVHCLVHLLKEVSRIAAVKKLWTGGGA